MHLKNDTGDRKLAKTKCYVRQLKERQLGAFCVCFVFFSHFVCAVCLPVCGYCIEFPQNRKLCNNNLRCTKMREQLGQQKKRKTKNPKTETSCVVAFVLAHC